MYCRNTPPPTRKTLPEDPPKCQIRLVACCKRKGVGIQSAYGALASHPELGLLSRRELPNETRC